MHSQIGHPISKRYQKTAKQSSLNSIRDALPNTHTLNLKISQEFALEGGEFFDILANNNETHADGVFISAIKCSI